MGCFRKQTRNYKNLSRVAAIEMEKEGISSSAHGKYFKESLVHWFYIESMVSQNNTEKLGYTDAILA